MGIWEEGEGRAVQSSASGESGMSVGRDGGVGRWGMGVRDWGMGEREGQVGGERGGLERVEEWGERGEE